MAALVTSGPDFGQPSVQNSNFELPTELILDVIDLAVLINRDIDRFWTLNLSLISRTFRHIVMHRAYEITILHVFYDNRDQTNRHRRETAFFIWLLHNPNAAPRRYIRHLGTIGSVYKASTIASELEKVVTSSWDLDCVSLSSSFYELDAQEALLKVGIRPRNIRICGNDLTTIVHVTGSLPRAYAWIKGDTLARRLSMMLHIWPRKPRHNGTVLRYTYWMPGNISTEREREKIIVIGIGDPNSGFDELSPDVVEDIFGLLLDDAFRPFQLVLLCDDDYAYQNRTLNQILCDAADARADIDDQQLMHRVWVAGRMIGHAALSNSNPELALFRLEADLVRERRRLVPV